MTKLIKILYKVVACIADISYPLSSSGDQASKWAPLRLAKMERSKEGWAKMGEKGEGVGVLPLSLIFHIFECNARYAG